MVTDFPTYSKATDINKKRNCIMLTIPWDISNTPFNLHRLCDEFIQMLEDK